MAAALLAGCLLLSGCATGWHRTSQPAAAAADRPRLSDAELDRLADAYAHYAQGVMLETRGEEEPALEEYRQALEADPSNELLAVQLAGRYLQKQQPDQAVNLLREVLKANPDAGGLYGWLGMAHQAAGRTNEAARAFRECTRRAPDVFIGYAGLARMAYEARDAKTALDVLDKAAGRPVEDPRFWVSLADTLAMGVRQKVLTNEQVRDRIKRALDRADAANPDAPDLLQRMAELYRAGGFLPEAIRYYERLVGMAATQSPGLQALLREQLYRLYLQTGDKEKAEAQLRALLDLNPTNPQIRLLLARAAVERRDFPEAVRHLEQLLLVQPDFEPAYYELISVHLQADQPDEAEAVLARVRERFKPGFQYELTAGVLAMVREQYAEAVRHLTRAETLGREEAPERLDGRFYFQLGSACERAGDYEQAVRYLKRSLELDPGNPVTLNYLGYMWADRGENLEEALRLIQQAVEKDPDNPAYLDSLAWALYKLGRAAEALPHQLRAVVLQKEPDATLLDHLGDIHAALGHKDQARDAYDRALAIKDDPAIRRKRDALDP